jgi:hypothetical protein
VLALLVDDPDLFRVPAHDPMLDFVAVSPFRERCRVGRVDRGPIIGVDDVEKGPVSRAEFTGRQPEDSICLVRPGQSVVHEVELPTSQMGDFLGAFQALLAFAQTGCALLHFEFEFVISVLKLLSRTIFLDAAPHPAQEQNELALVGLVIIRGLVADPGEGHDSLAVKNGHDHESLNIGMTERQPLFSRVGLTVIVHKQRSVFPDGVRPDAGIYDMPLHGITRDVTLLDNVFGNRMERINRLVLAQESHKPDLAAGQGDGVFKDETGDFIEGSLAHLAHAEERIKPGLLQPEQPLCLHPLLVFFLQLLVGLPKFGCSLLDLHLQLVFRIAQRLLGLLALGDVVIRADEPANSALVVEHRLGADQHPSEILARRGFHGHQFVLHGSARYRRLAHRVFVRVQENALFVEDLPLAPIPIVDVLDESLVGEVKHLKESPVDDAEPAPVVDQCHRRLQVLG